MRSATPPAQPSAENEHPVSRVVIVFVLAILLLFGGLGLGVALLRVGQAMSSLQRQALANEASTMASNLANFLEDHLIVLKDQADSPILGQAVTRPGQDPTAERIMAAYVDNLSLLGARATYYVLDRQGRLLHSSDPSMPLPERAPTWVAEVLNGREAGYIGVYSRGERHVWHLGAPILVHGRPQGILAAQLLLDLARLAGRELPASGRMIALRQNGRVLATLGAPLDHAFSRSDPVPGLGLTLDYQADAAQVGEFRRRLFLEVSGLFLAMGVVCIVLFQRVGRRWFVLPHQRLTAARALLQAANLELEREVAERRAAEASLRLYESAVEQARESIIITDADWEPPGPRIVLVNPGFTEMTGFTPEEALGRSPRIMQGPRTDRRVLAELRSQLMAGGEFHGEAINYRKDGSEFYIEWHVAPIVSPEGRTTHYVAIQRDVTERVLAAQRLAEAEARYRSVVESINEVIFQTDEQARWTFLNPAWTEITGFAMDESLGRSLFDFVPPEDEDDLKARLSPLLRGRQETARLELRYLTKSGDIRWIEAAVRLLAGEEGRYHGATGTLADVTERKKAEQALARAREREVSLGARIQQSLLLGNPPRQTRGLVVDAISVASQRIDGDFYDFLSHGPEVLDVVIGDVMGKGVPAALLGAAAKSYFPRAFSELVSVGAPGALPRPESVVQEVHRRLTPELIKLGSFVTLCYARFNLRLGMMSFVDCGHTRLIHHSPDQGVTRRLQGDNMPLGFDEDETYRELTTALVPGDLVVLYSDGITEAADPAGRLFGEDLLLRCIGEHAELPPDELVDAIRRAVIDFRGSDRLADDLTCLAVKLEAPLEEPLESLRRILSGNLQDLAAIRLLVGGLCGRWQARTGVGPKGRDKLVLAVHEAASNILKHAYRDRPERPLWVRAEAYPGRVQVSLVHNGLAFRPEEAPPPVFDGSRESGFGLYLIKECVDLFMGFRDHQDREGLLLVKYGKE